VGKLKGVGRVYLHTVVDTHGSCAFGFLHTSKTPEAAVASSTTIVSPSTGRRDSVVVAVLTDNGTEFCGKDGHPSELYLASNDEEHRRTRVRSPQTKGFVERFHRTVLDEFSTEAFRSTFYESVESLQADLGAWLHHCNDERPHLGHRNMGKRPSHTINEFIQTVDNQAS
jgi:transposase InsO family protein